MGARITRDIVIATGKLYAPLLAKMPTDGVKVTADQAYGPDTRNKLDVYQPEAARTKRTPIVVSLHGGGFVRGDKRRYANLGTYFARHGIIGMIANYRFAPHNKWPSGAEDIALVIKWIQQNGVKYGGDARRVFLMGNSAGAIHVASYVFSNAFTSTMTALAARYWCPDRPMNSKPI
jgi:triacylglycerol lipase